MNLVHPYVSTACAHSMHADCRRTCKFCTAPCLCLCHYPDADAHATHRKLDLLIAQGERILMVSQQTKDALSRIETATTDLGVRVSALIAKIGTGMSDAEVTEVNTELGAIAGNLEGMAKDPENPV